MKRTLCTLVGLVICASVGFAQNSSSEQSPPAASANPAVTENAGQTQPTASDTKVSAPAAEAPAPAPATNPSKEAPAPAVVAASDTAPAPTATTATTTNGAQPGAVIPLIVMDDVPLTDAIKNLAR